MPVCGRVLDNASIVPSRESDGADALVTSIEPSSRPLRSCQTKRVSSARVTPYASVPVAEVDTRASRLEDVLIEVLRGGGAA